MNKPLVSIITPCYNSEKWIERYFKSILAQTYKRIELIIINDGSTDKTEEIVLSYKRKFINKRYSLIYKYQSNKGLGGAINTGLKLVNGDYFTWCDSDNFYTDDYIKTKVEFFVSNPQYSIVRCDGYIVKDSDITKPITTMAYGNNEKFKEDLFYNALEVKNFHFGCAMVKTSDFDKINPKRDIYASREGQNWQLLLPMFYHYKSGYIDKPMFYFVYRSDSISNITTQKGLDKKIAKNNEYINILVNTLKFMNIPEEEKCLDIVYKRFAKINLYFAYKHNNEQVLGEQYNKLQQLHAVNGKDKIYYYCGNNKCLDIGFKVIKISIRVLRKLKRMLLK